MAKSTTFRFASGSPERAFSGVWRMIVSGSDVYLGVGGKAMGLFKVSLHQSGVWILAGTQHSGVTFNHSNRRAKRWQRPLEHSLGVTRGPTVVVPNTSIGSRPVLPGDVKKAVTWFPAPEVGELVEFNIYFVKPGAPTAWDQRETLLFTHHLKSGEQLLLFATSRPLAPEFAGAVEGLLRDTIVRMKDPNDHAGGSLLWFTESRGPPQIPLLIDLPFRVLPEESSTGS